MKYKATPAVLLFLFPVVFMSGVFAQSRQNIPEYLKQRFARYIEAVPREELYVHTDREAYIAGESVWFAIYLVDRQSLKPSSNSSIAYVELLNAGNRPVVQKKFLIDHGFGPGQITLPDTLSSGSYTLRAYTNWMKNFLPDNCFVMELAIYNALNIQAFKGKSQAGNISISETGSSSARELKNTGIALYADNSGPDSLEITVKTDKRFPLEINSPFYLFIQTHGNIDHVSTEEMKGEATEISIPKTLLSAGINQITIFNAKGEPVAERYVYTPSKETGQFTLDVNDSCGPRSKITLNMSFGTELPAAKYPANVSISVAPWTGIQEIAGMSDYLIFGTEYGRQSVNAFTGRRINGFSAEFIDSMLLHVSSNWISWDKILKGERQDLKYRIEREDHWLSGQLLNSDQRPAGRDEFLLLCNPGKEAEFQYTRTDAEGNFSFGIPMDERPNDIIIMPDDADRNRRIVVESSFAEPSPESGISADSAGRRVLPFVSKMSVNYQVGKIYGNTEPGDPLKQAFPLKKPLRFYGRPDIELVMADYIKLPVMEEVFFELLPHVSLKKSKGEYEIFITDRIDNTPYFTSPCLMIDGVIIKDPSLIINLDPEIVEKIDVIIDGYVVGGYFFPGIVNVITKPGDFSCVSLPQYMVRMPYRVIDPVWSFVSPDYSASAMKNSRIPDYRNTLYWNPSVKTDQSGKASMEWWSGDTKSDYVINIQGITTEGKVISLKKIVKVK